MEPVGFYASERHYIDHLAPIWHALQPEERAWFVTGSQAAYRHAQTLGLPVELDRKSKRRHIGHVVVASFNDLRAHARHRLVFVEHGAGQTYPVGEAGHSHYAGGRARRNVDLFICPSERVAQANRAAYPDAAAVAVGSPRLDALLGEPPRPRNGAPTIAVSFHFDCKLSVPEARWAYPFFADAVAHLQEDTGWPVLGHAHPRVFGILSQFYEQHGIEPVANFDEVCARANVYACDNSSTIFEFAALDRPVVLLNAPWYRRYVEHGLRFWEYADIGWQIDDPTMLPAGVQLAWEDQPDIRARRRAVSAALFGPLDGGASARAAAALRAHLP